MSPEQKLALIQQMRQQETEKNLPGGSGSFRLRFLFAVFLFLLFFYMDLNDYTLGTWDSGAIQAQISKAFSYEELAGFGIPGNDVN